MPNKREAVCRALNGGFTCGQTSRAQLSRKLYPNGA
nr:MAG TPA: hypothetical protein [Caudoviricetes sp.]DAL50441.1 MAG TPA_asm: hypothetical protein [Caudoviricetes sp.]